MNGHLKPLIMGPTTRSLGDNNDHHGYEPRILPVLILDTDAGGACSWLLGRKLRSKSCRNLGATEPFAGQPDETFGGY